MRKIFVKVVLDTNVWISSLLIPQSIPGQIIAAWQHTLFDIAISSPILDEIKRVLNYPTIKKRLSLSLEEIDEYLTLIRFFTDVVDVKTNDPLFGNELRDINDTPIINTLIISHADYLITGDQDLLVLSKKYPIISPNEFAKFLD
ncbi:MAG: putative toxin-antitoxin system toxin component, PIN family [Gammaproteobacteria bacterium]|nr:MAG: putative toxin-antitoxin system toxin component, PIN family [Gammaproteobacteria bacterium]